MKEDNLKLVQKDINDALEAIEAMEENLKGEDVSKDNVREKFLLLTQKLNDLENVLKSEGIL